MATGPGRVNRLIFATNINILKGGTYHGNDLPEQASR